MVYYLATDGSGYKWSDEALTRDLGEDIVEAGETVERRVLEIPADRSYITVEPEQTAESYAEGLRGKYTRIIGLSTLYILFYLIILILVKLVNRLRKNRAADQEVERAAVPRNVSAASQLGPEIGESRRSRLPESWSGWRQEPGGDRGAQASPDSFQDETVPADSGGGVPPGRVSKAGKRRSCGSGLWLEREHMDL